MRKLVALAMLWVLLGTQTEFRQLLRLPVLFEHFREHRLANPDLSFLSFLRMHYENREFDADYYRDQQLPFRDISTAMTLVLLDTPPAAIRLDKIPTLRELHQPVSRPLDFARQPYLQDIFQPPRLT